MTPLQGTKTPSTPAGDKSGGDRKAARSLLSCALWRGMGRLRRGMGGMGRPEPLSAHRPHRQQGLSGFHETRDTNHGLYAFHESQLPYPRFPTISHDFPAFPGISRHFPAPPPPPPPIKCPRAVRLSWSAARDCRPRPVAAFLRVVARHGAAMARHGRHGAPRATVRAPSAPPTRPFGFSRNTRHESRNTAFFRTAAFVVARHGRLWRGMGGILPRAGVLAPSAVLGRPHDERRSPGCSQRRERQMNPF